LVTVSVDKEPQQATFGLAIWQHDEYILGFLFAVQLQFRPDEQSRAIE
jgi:hypothetical protein